MIWFYLALVFSLSTLTSILVLHQIRAARPRNPFLTVRAASDTSRHTKAASQRKGETFKSAAAPSLSIVALLLLCSSVFASTNTTWSLVYSNSQDGWEGPVGALEISADGSRILKIVPLLYAPFNTNTSLSTNYVVFKIPFTITNAINTNAINKAVDEGLVCAVRGHTWQSGCQKIGCLAYHWDVQMRHCLLCKVQQTRGLGDWK